MSTPKAAAAEWVAISALRPWKNNPRRNQQSVAEVAESISRWGFGAPILARKANGEVIAGHTRLLAAKKLGLTEVPVRYLDLTEAEAHALALADNKVGELSEWDDEMLAAVLHDLKSAGTDILSGTGFSQEALDALLEGSSTELPERAAKEIRDVECPHCGKRFVP